MADEMMIQTMADTEIYISESSVPSKLDSTLSDFSGHNYIEVNGSMTIGEVGGEQAINTYEPIKGKWVLKAKGSRDGGTMTNVFIPIPLDPGQQKLAEAAGEDCRPYAFKLVRGASCSPEATVTISMATPGVVTWTGSNFSAGQPVVFSTTGTMPTGLTAGTVYYVIAAGLTANTFSVAATPGGAGINTTAAGSGTITAVAPPVGMTEYFQGFVTSAVSSGGSRNDQYTRTYGIAINGPIIRV